MLFRKKIDPHCAYCANAGLVDEERMVCRHKGIVEAGNHCRRFRYDPLKRTPSRPKPLMTQDFDPKDFIL